MAESALCGFLARHLACEGAVFSCHWCLPCFLIVMIAKEGSMQAEERPERVLVLDSVAGESLGAATSGT